MNGSHSLLIQEILCQWNELLAKDFEGFDPTQERITELLVLRYGFCRDRANREAATLLSNFAERLRRAAA